MNTPAYINIDEPSTQQSSIIIDNNKSIEIDNDMDIIECVKNQTTSSLDKNNDFVILSDTDSDDFVHPNGIIQKNLETNTINKIFFPIKRNISSSQNPFDKLNETVDDLINDCKSYLK